MFMAFDIGEKRIGIAIADAQVRLAWPVKTVTVTQNVKEVLAEIVNDSGVEQLVVGRPLNQSGEPTKQTTWVEDFVAANLSHLNLPIIWQEESLTSVHAEERLKKRTKNYTKDQIDSEAAAIILQDFLEAN